MTIRKLLCISILFSLCCCQEKEGSPVPDTSSINTSVSTKYEKIKMRNEKIQAEMDYYMQRHNVRDEGFDMVARYAEEGDSTLFHYMPDGKVEIRNIIKWRLWSRQGKGITTDHLGRIIIGKFNADTLVSGIRIDSIGIYAGRFNRAMEACGHGSYRTYDGSYYEGHWQHDQREGFGFCVDTNNLKAGRWHLNRFLGERMNYTSMASTSPAISTRKAGSTTPLTGTSCASPTWDAASTASATT